MNNNLKQTRIEGFYELRLLAFIFVFLSHIGIGLEQLGAAGVSIFIMMSGFLMVYNYYNRNICQNPFSFSVKKIAALYPLHIVLMLWGVTIQIASSVIKQRAIETGETIGYIISNLLLIQAWIPKRKFYFSLNAVSWYLSLCLFFYFMFPFIIRKVKRIKEAKTSYIYILCLVVLMAMLSIFAKIFMADNSGYSFSIHWFTYIFPLVRLIEFIIGGLLAWGMMKTYKKIRSYQIYLILGLLLIIALVYGFVLNVPIINSENVKYSFVWFPSSVLLIVGFFYKKNQLNKIVIFLSELTPYAFLIHLQSIHVINLILRVFFENQKMIIIMTGVGAFIITMISSWMYKKMYLYITNMFG